MKFFVAFAFLAQAAVPSMSTILRQEGASEEVREHDGRVPVADVPAAEANESESFANLLAFSSHDLSLQRKMTRSEAVLGAFELELEKEVATKYGDVPASASDPPSAEVEQRSFRVMLFAGALVSICGAAMLVTLMQVWASERAKRDNTKIGQRGVVPPLAIPLVSRGGSKPVATGEADSLEWLNTILENIWPHVDKAVQALVNDSVGPALRKSVPGAEISKFTLGDAVPILGPIEVHRSHDGVEARIQVDYQSDLDLSIRWGLVYVGVKSLSFKGQLHIKFSPFIDETPVVGGIQMYFLNAPDINMDMTGAANIADCPGFADILHSTVSSSMASACVLPNVVGVQLGTSQQVDPVAVMTAQPVGLVRVTVVRASDLMGADWHLAGSATSDPYVHVSVADREWRSMAVSGTTDPVWPQGEGADFMVFDLDQQLRVAVYDKNSVCSDGVLGYAGTLTVEEALNRSGKPLALYEDKPGHDVEADSPCSTHHADIGARGTLVLKFDWLELDAPMLRAPCTTFTPAPSPQAVVTVEVMDIVLPGDLAADCTAVSLRASLAGVTGATALRYETPQDTAKEDAAMESVALRLAAHGVAPRIVADVTNLSETEVAQITNGGQVDRDRRVGPAQKTFCMQASLHLLVNGSDTEGDDIIDFAILDQNGVLLAETKQRLSGVPVNGQSGGVASAPPLVFRGADMQRARGQIALSVQGLRFQGQTAPARRARDNRRGANNPFGFACC